MAPWERYQKKSGPWAKYAGEPGEGLVEEDRGFLDFLNQGIASALGAPVDLVNAGLGAAGIPTSDTPFGGSASIGRGMSKLGVRVAEPTDRPETLSDYMGAGLGGAAGALLPGAGAVSAALRASSPVVSGAGKMVARPFISTPGRALAAEGAAGAGAGTGMSVADEVAPDNPQAQIVGALLGGGIAGLGPNLVARGARSLPGVQLAEDFVAGQIAPFTERGAMSRARGRIGGLVEDAPAARANLERGTIGELSPAVSTGDRRLMALEQAVRSQESPVDLSMRQAETQSMDTLRSAAREPGGGVSPEVSKSVLAGRVEGLTKKMRDRTAQAIERAQQRVAELEPRNKQSQSSIIVREELEEALSAARAQEREVWGRVPREEMVPTQRGRAVYRELTDDMARAQRDDIPVKARRFLEGDSNETFKDMESVKEVHGLYSALREEARTARAANEANKARIADRVADALLEDLGAVGSAKGPLREALDFSRELNKTFRQGNVGRVLGSERAGGETVAPELTLETTVGRGGVRGSVAMDELSAATKGTSPAVPDFVQSRFSDAAVRNGNLSPERAQTFVRQNRDVLDKLPDVQQRIARALTEGEAAARTETRMGERAGRVGQSAAARFSGAAPGAEIQAILRSPNPRQTAAQVIRQAGKNNAGVKSALVDDLISGARTRQFDEAGQPMISGRALKARLSDDTYSAVAGEILSPSEMSRMNQIADEFSRIETMQGRLPEVGPIMGDQPNSMIAYLARVMAARSGAAMGAGTSGASLQTASMASSRMQRILQGLTNDKAEQLIIKAVTGDKELFDALLQPGSQISRQQENRVIETLSGITGSQVGSSEESPQDRIARQLMQGAP